MRAAALGLLIAVTAVGGTKHDFDRPVFVYLFHPDVPMSRFVSGQIGIPEPQHARIYLFAAYRYLEGKPLSRAEQARWMSVWRLRAFNDYSEPGGSGRWGKVRAKVVSVPAKGRAARSEVPLRGFVYEAICGEDAFDVAATTLTDRIRRFGVSSAEVKFWTQGQDAVFDACGGFEFDPLRPAPASMHPLIQADRDYQIAASLLYQQHFDEAAEAFRKVAQSPSSPWRVWAPYQIGRSLLWKARQTQSDQTYAQNVALAEAQFRSVVADRKLAASHRAAEYLMLRCMMITNRKGALERIGRKLASGRWTESELQLYLTGMDYLLNGDPWDGVPDKWPPRREWPDDPVSRWILSFQAERSGTHAIQMWRHTGSRAWLYAALWRATAEWPDEVLDAALSARLEDGASAALRYAAAYQLGRKQRFDEARALVDRVIAELAELPSARNSAAGLRMLLARARDEFLRLAPRKAILASSELDRFEWESQDKPDLEWVAIQQPQFRAELRRSALARAAEAAGLMSLPRFDQLTADVFNDVLPLQAWSDMATSPLLPDHLRIELALAAWTRAVLLQRWDIARTLAPWVEKLAPVTAAAIQAFMEAPSEENAAVVLVRLPGARPYVSYGYGRISPVTEHHEFGLNWWYRFTPDEMDMDLQRTWQPWDGAVFFEQAPLPVLPFVTGREKSDAARERAQLRKSGERGLHWIATRVTRAVERDPRRPDAAELLFRVLDGARVGQWAHVPDLELPQPGVEKAYRLLSTRFRRTKWFARYQKLEPHELLHLRGVPGR